MLCFDTMFSPAASKSGVSYLQQQGTFLLTMETTGLSPRNSFVMMAALAHCMSDGWHQKILIAENRREETSLLTDIRSALEEADTLCFFGYASFFRRFVNDRWENISGCSEDFFRPELTIKDLQQQLKAVRHLLPLENLSRRSIETYIGYQRKAPLAGSHIAECYSKYQQNAEKQLPGDIITHLTEDIQSYFTVTSLESYCQLTDGRLLLDPLQPFETDDDHLYIHSIADEAFPLPLSHTDEYRRLELGGKRVTLTIPLYAAKLKYYYPGLVSDYYYLPEEDRAIHKSIAVFVDKKHRKKATKATCYTSQEGLFLRCPPSADLSPLFYADRNHSPAFIAFDPEKWQKSPEDLRQYMLAVINS